MYVSDVFDYEACLWAMNWVILPSPARTRKRARLADWPATLVGPIGWLRLADWPATLVGRIGWLTDWISQSIWLGGLAGWIAQPVWLGGLAGWLVVCTQIFSKNFPSTSSESPRCLLTMLDRQHLPESTHDPSISFDNPHVHRLNQHMSFALCFAHV